MTSQKKVFKLIALRPDETSISIAMNVRFGRITPDYVLVYVEENKIIEWVGLQPYIIIGESEKERLSERDKEWLLGCNLSILAEESSKQNINVLNEVQKKLHELEEALEEEKKKLSDEEQ